MDCRNYTSAIRSGVLRIVCVCTRDLHFKFTHFENILKNERAHDTHSPFMVYIWMVICVVAISMFTWQIVTTWTDFIENPILSTYSVVCDPRGVRFPIIYICPYNPIYYSTEGVGILDLSRSKEPAS